MSPTTVPPADVPVKQQRAWVLNHIASSASGELPLKKATAAPPWAKQELGLTPDVARRLLEQLMGEQLLIAVTKGKSEKVAITQAGREQLDQLTEFIPRPLTDAEKMAKAVREKVATLGDAAVPVKKLGKPSGKKATADQTAAFDAAIEQLVAEGVLFPHPDGKYGTRPLPTVEEVVRREVQAKLDNAAGPFKKADLSKPKRGASAEDRQAHADALDEVIAELVADIKLFPHAGGKYGQLPEKSLIEVVREEVAAKLPGLNGTFKPADLSQPKAGAKKAEKKAHAEALDEVIGELIAEKKLFRHPDDLYGQLPPPPPPPLPDREIREVYTLDVISQAPDRTISKADIELAFPGKGKPEKKKLEAQYPHVARFRGQGCFEMGAPATRQSLEQLVAAGDLRSEGGDDAVVYTLTEQGAERLRHSREAYPVLPPVGEPATPDGPAMREMWEAFVLLKLAEASGHTLAGAAAFAFSYPKGSKLNEATAWTLYGELATAGLLTAKWNGTEGEYTLTPQGLRYLAGRSFDGFDKLEVRGATLTALLAAARGGQPSPASVPTAVPATSPPPSAEVLEQAVMSIFQELLRERYANIRMVPIHEVRTFVRTLYGEQAASREVFNELLLDMRREKKVRLVSITDRNQATEAEIQDSVIAVGETFFYLEKADAQASS